MTGTERFTSTIDFKMTGPVVEAVLSRQLGIASFSPPGRVNPWGLVSLILYGLGFILFGLENAKRYGSLR